MSFLDQTIYHLHNYNVETYFVYKDVQYTTYPDIHAIQADHNSKKHKPWTVVQEKRADDGSIVGEFTLSGCMCYSVNNRYKKKSHIHQFWKRRRNGISSNVSRTGNVF